MNIAIVGAGTVGTAVAVRWAGAGHTIVGATGRASTADRVATWLPGVPFTGIDDVVPLADVVVIAVPDAAIAETAVAVARSVGPGSAAAHFSGALGLEVLDPIAEAGATVVATHPLQTFADVAGAVESLVGTTVAVTARDDEGWRLGDGLASDLGGSPFHLSEEHRAAYHAAAVFASNYLVTISAAAQELFEAADVPDPARAMRPLQAATLANVHRLGPRDALTGPAVRGDAGTIERNLRAIADAAPHLTAAYVILCRTTLDVAADRLDPAGRAALEEVLARWS